jgi:hypothetical protein
MSDQSILAEFGVSDTNDRMAESNPAGSSSCPICGSEFDTRHGMKIHASRLHDTSLAGEPTECGNCGTDMRRPKHQLEKYNNVFCSDECEVEWRTGRLTGEDHPNYDRVTLTCEHCGEDWDAPEHKEATARFCSTDCKADFESENRSGSDAPAWEGGLSTVDAITVAMSMKCIKHGLMSLGFAHMIVWV